MSTTTVWPTGSRVSRTRVLLRAAIALLTASVACSDDPLAPACSGAVDVTVSGSSPPVVRWTPDCSVDRLSAVTPPSMGFAQSWSIVAGDRRIESGVRFGQIPSGAVEESSPGFIIMSGTSFSILLESPRGTVVGTTFWSAP